MPDRLLVLGAGPGGYAAAFLAADRGMDVTLVDAESQPGGVCLHRGCIPSKALLHAARLVTDARDAEDWGLHFEPPAIDLDKLRARKQSVVDGLTRGLGALGRQRRVKYVQGRGHFEGPHALHLTSPTEVIEFAFDYAIVATGSLPAVPQALRLDSPLVMDSTAALELRDVPDSLLVVGGGYIGLELGTVYAALGSRVTIVEMTPGLLPGADRDLVEPLRKRLEQSCELLLNTRVAEMREHEGGIRARLTGGDEDSERDFAKVLVAVGRVPNTRDAGLETTAVKLDQRGFVEVDAQRRTAEPSIYAIGDVAGEPMLAHKAAHEGRTAVAAMLGEPAAFEPAAIPAVVYTDPEIAWCGLTEADALARGLEVDVAKFPWAALGRAATVGRPEGLTKLVLERGTERVLGVGIVGAGAGDLIAEGVLAVEMGATATDLCLTIHPHPTLSESMMEAAEVFFGESSHYIARRRRD